MRAVVLLLPLCAGCLGPGEPFFRIQNRSCNARFTTWHGGLTYHLLQGSGNGSFNYDPDGLLVRQIRGDYDLDSGDFAWRESFNADHWRVGVWYDGYGYAATSGDLDIAATVTREDIAGVVTTWAHREVREGCDVTRKLTFEDGTVVWHDGSYSRARYDWVEQEDVDGVPWLVEGTLYDDRSSEESLDYSGPSFAYAYDQFGDGAGYSRRDFVQVTGDSTWDGYSETFIDGSQHESYTWSSGADNAVWDYTLDYWGNGTGTLQLGGDTCSVTFNSFNCSYSCSSGTGDC